jgi:two-component system, cell cycle response regulator
MRIMQTIIKSLTQEFDDPKTGALALNSVLIAEDDPIFRRILESWFKRWDYQVTAVQNGLDAWEVLQKDDAPPLAVLDWMMPGLDGIELCSKIRSRDQGPYRYVILLTAKDEKQDLIAGLEAGADDYLTKPFDVDELHARVRAGKRILDLQAALMEAQRALRYDASHDGLTTIWNRSAILDLLIGEMERSRRSGESMGIIMADIDFFKKINDSHGHLVGDAVLREVGHRLQSGLRSYDSVGRYGGEEFLVVVPGCDPLNLKVTAERLRRKVADTPVETAAGPVPVTISLGLAATQVTASGLVGREALLHDADQALYAAKAAGRNRVESAPVALEATQNGN